MSRRRRLESKQNNTFFKTRLMFICQGNWEHVGKQGSGSEVDCGPMAGFVPHLYLTHAEENTRVNTSIEANDSPARHPSSFALRLT